MLVDLSPGKIVVNEIWHATSGDNFHAFEIDLGSKYPSDVSWDYGDDNIRVWIEDGPDTLYAAGTPNITFVTIPVDGDPGRWRVLSEARRYTWRIVLWRPDRSDDED